MKKALFLLSLAIILLPHHINAVDLLTNGSFETGNFSGWTAANPPSGWRLWAVSASGAGGNDGGAFVPVPNATIVQHGTRSAWNGVAAGAGESFTLFQQVSIPAGQSASVQWIDRYQMNFTQFCTTTCGTAQYIVEITNTSGVVLQTLYSVTTNTNTNTNTGFVTHFVNLGTGYGGQTIRIRFRTIVSASVTGPGQVEIDNVRLNAPAVLNPTSAEASISGRALTSDGAGIAKTTITLSDSTGIVRTALTNPMGYYSFTDLPTGRTYVLTISNKRYIFPGSPHIHTLQDDLTSLDFVASP